MKNEASFQIFLHSPCTDSADREQIIRTLESGWIAPGGPWAKAFEEKISRMTDAPYALALSNGTAALHLALKLLGMEAGDTVIVPSHTYIASASPVHYEKGRIVVVDSERESLNMSPRYLEHALEKLKQEGIRPRAVIITHIYGLPARLDELSAVAGAYGVPIIEDAAESVGSWYRGRHTGTWGNMGILSFNGNKTITAGGGGALLVKEKHLWQRGKKWAGHAKEDFPYFYHKEWGYNYQIPALTASLGISQLSKLARIVSRKREIHDTYTRYLSALPLQAVNETGDAQSNYWLNAFLTEKSGQASALTDFLQSHGIEARRFWFPLHRMPLLKDAMYVGSDETVDFFERGVLLPSSPCLSEEEMEKVTDTIRKFYA